MKLAVDAIVLDIHGKMVFPSPLIQRKYEPFKNAWAIPGGFGTGE